MIKQILYAINIRIDNNLKKKIFNNHKKCYKEAINNSGHKNELKYVETKTHNNN